MSSSEQLTPVPDDELDLEQLFRQTIELVDDAKSLGFTGLTEEPPAESNVRARSSSSTPTRKLIVNEEERKTLDLLLKQLARAKRCRQPFNSYAKLHEVTAKKRKLIIERVVQAKTERNILGKKKKPWVQQMRSECFSKFEYSIAWGEYSTRALLTSKLEKAIYVPVQTKDVLLEDGKALKSYWFTHVRNRKAEICQDKASNENADDVTVEWKKLLWLEARAQSWIRDAHDALIGSKLCELNGEFSWLLMVVHAARKLEDEHNSTLKFDFEFSQKKLEKSFAKMHDMAYDAFSWPKYEDTITIHLDMDPRYYVYSVKTSLEKLGGGPELAKLHEALVDTAKNAIDNTPLTHADDLIHKKEREAYSHKIELLKTKFENEYIWKRKNYKLEPSYPIILIDQLEEIMIEWCAIMFQRDTRLFSELPPPRSENEENALGPGAWVAVQPAMSARMARMYNI